MICHREVILLLLLLAAAARAAEPLAKRESLGLRFTPDFQAGYDQDHQWMGGTETMGLVAHGGRLFASMGYWADTQPGADPVPGAQILRKDAAGRPWRVDVTFGKDYLRVEALKPLTLATDSAGRRLEAPVELLVASPFHFQQVANRPTVVAVRDDATGQWVTTPIAPMAGGVRAFVCHVDAASKTHLVFAGTWGGRIFRGSYDPAAPGRLRWGARPEHTGTGRVMALAECDGVLYAACGLKDESPVSGGLYRRLDGPEPKWEQVYRWEYAKQVPGDEDRILRGLLAVPDPRDGHEVLIGARAVPGVIERIDPRQNHAVIVELSIPACFAQVFGVQSYVRPALAAYNWPTPFTDPATGQTVHLIGLWVQPPGRLTPPHNGSYFLVRKHDGTYEWGNVYDPEHSVPAGRSLRGTRAICVSPFAEDRGRVLYFGGFDAFGGPHHNTAWIYRAVAGP